ncbi:hypothetical protein MTO96_037831 [Rhipicephalus appendiculatus]
MRASRDRKDTNKLSGLQDLPPVYPNGWFPIIESQELKVKQVKRVDVLVPDFVKVKTWTTAELLGNVFLWYHADGEEPSWQVEDIPGGDERPLESVDATRGDAQLPHPGRGRERVGRDALPAPSTGPNLLLSPEEFAKNAGDTTWGRFFTHLWTAKWHVDEHRCCVDIEAKIRVLGRCPRLFDIVSYLRLQGPALLVVRVESSFGAQLTVAAITPLGPFRIRVVHTTHFAPRTNLIFRWLASIAFKKTFERDLLVWNHKKLLLKPPLLKGDKTIADFRKWYKQFYSQSSPTWQDIRLRTLEW